jgi:hypothetical protein
MNAPNDNTVTSRLRAWWASPPRSGLRRFIAPYEYRRLFFFGVGRIIGGVVAVVAAHFCFSYQAYAWGAFFLAIGALNILGGAWFVSITRSPGYRT